MNVAGMLSSVASSVKMMKDQVAWDNSSLTCGCEDEFVFVGMYEPSVKM